MRAARATGELAGNRRQLPKLEQRWIKLAERAESKAARRGPWSRKTAAVADPSLGRSDPHADAVHGRDAVPAMMTARTARAARPR